MDRLSTTWLSPGLGRRFGVLTALVLAAALSLAGLGLAGPAKAWAADGEDSPEAHPEASKRSDEPESALPWYVPSHLKVQYAGNIGWLSGGAGYTYLDDILQTELFVGYVPAFTGDNRLFMTTLKQVGIPYEFTAAEHLRIVPIYAGGFATYTFGDDYYVFAPEHLEGTYSRQTALRFGPMVGGRVRADIEPFGPIQTLGAYWELSINDLAISAYFANPEFFSLDDVLALGLGLRVGFK